MSGEGPPRRRRPLTGLVAQRQQDVCLVIEQLHPATGHDTGGPAAVVRAHAGTVPARVLAAAGLDRCERLLGDVRQLLSTEPPRSGFAMLNDEAQSLRLFVLWPHYDGSQP